MASALPPAWVPWQRELRDSGLDPTAKAVGLVLSTYMDGAGRAQVSRATIAAGVGLADLGTVTRAIQRLESAGLLGVDRAGRQQHAPSRYQVRSRGGWPATAEPPRGGPSATPGNGQGWLRSAPGVAGEPHEREGLETIARGRAPEGWVPEDDEAIAAVYRERELDAAERAKGSSEGYGDPAQATAARQAAVEARRVLGAQRGTDPRP